MPCSSLTSTVRTNLLSLPSEILANIADFADINSFINLRRASRAFLSLDERRLWEHLHLTLPRYYGALPQITPLPMLVDTSEDPDKIREYHNWAEVQIIFSLGRYRTGLRDKIKQIVRSATPSSWAWVKSVTMAPQFDSIQYMMFILDLVSPTLQHLHIEAAPLHPFLVPTNFDRIFTCPLSLDDIDTRLSFPALTHLTMSNLSSASGDFLLFLLHLSPHVIALDVTFDREEDEEFDLDAARERSLSTSSLRKIRFAWGDRAGMEDFPAADLLIALLRDSPDLQQVDISFGRSVRESTYDELLEALIRHRKIKDLRWPLAICKELEDSWKLRRLVIGSHSTFDALCFVTNMPLLEALYFDSDSLRRSAPTPKHSVLSHLFSAQGVSLTLFEALIAFPALHTIGVVPHRAILPHAHFFDDVEHFLPDNLARISSMKCGENEIIQITFSQPMAGNSAGCLTLSKVRPLEEGQGSEGRNIQSSSHGSTFNAYQGAWVPEKIVKTMQEEEGGGAEKWDQRGVEVGIEAWAILEEWFSEQERREGDKAA